MNCSVGLYARREFNFAGEDTNKERMCFLLVSRPTTPANVAEGRQGFETSAFHIFYGGLKTSATFPFSLPDTSMP